MKRYSIFLLFLAVSCLQADLSVKEEIAKHQEALAHASRETSPSILVQLAKAHLKDQEMERGVKTFLQALNANQTEVLPCVPSREEEKLYHEALSLYLSSQDSMENSRQVLQAYAKVVEAHSDYYHLNYLVAVSYANLGMFERFFESFFASYVHLPHDYLAYKAQAVLHTLLLGKATSEEEKAFHKKEIYRCVQSALRSEGRDASLYKMLIVYADKGEQKQKVVEALESIIEKNVVVPRGDVVFYVEKAASNGEVEAALRFLEKAKEWYAYSRVLQQAEDLLVEGGGNYGR